jgi:MFS transporter, UMF1 family
MGKFVSVLGPFLMAATAAITGNNRSAILSVAILFVGGAIMLALQARSTRAAPHAAQEPA